ncbi:MAG: LytTR family DNA-binding domain-containing protein [Maribacter sp.]|uniref:LytTR family transcriptional regulator DNA-binding domain-containing protein n=1 Tax=Maribacter sp. TaxID=1897614 RepID=UPI003C70FB90
MWNIVHRFLSQPYPFYFEGKTFYTLLVVVFLMSFGFNYFFEPFNVYVPEHKMSYFLISLIHALVTAIVFFIMFLCLKLLPKQVEKWNVLKEILFLSSFLMLVGIGQFLIRDVIYDNPNNWSWTYLIEEIRNTFLVGILFVAILVPLNFSHLYRKNQNRASFLSPRTKKSENSQIYIVTDVKSDDFNLDITHFLYAKADRNYAEIFMQTDAGIDKKLKRISIKNLESQLDRFGNIIRTHRSYMVNLNHIVKINGNAQGYKLDLNASEGTVPVSRAYIPKLEESLKT